MTCRGTPGATPVRSTSRASRSPLTKWSPPCNASRVPARCNACTGSPTPRFSALLAAGQVSLPPPAPCGWALRRMPAWTTLCGHLSRMIYHQLLRKEGRMNTFAERVQLLQAESERIKQYLHSLSPAALSQASACAQWQVQDVIAHLIGVAETYAGNLARGLQGDTAPPAGRLPAGQNNAASSAAGIAQRS